MPVRPTVIYGILTVEPHLQNPVPVPTPVPTPPVSCLLIAAAQDNCHEVTKSVGVG
jgi:hypothetical protein